MTRVVVGDQNCSLLWSESKRLMDAGLQKFPSCLAFSRMVTLLPMPCQRPKYWLFALLPTGLKMTSLSLLISAYRSQPQHECLALSQSQKGVGCSPFHWAAGQATDRISSDPCS